MYGTKSLFSYYRQIMMLHHVIHTSITLQEDEGGPLLYEKKTTVLVYYLSTVLIDGLVMLPKLINASYKIVSVHSLASSPRDFLNVHEMVHN